jgi:hypothetical protein
MTEKKSRESPISYRPPQALRDEFHARVERSGLSVSAFITKAIFDAPPPRQARRPGAAQGDVARLLAETALVGDQLRALRTGGADDPQHDAALADALAALREIRAACLMALGRTP